MWNCRICKLNNLNSRNKCQACFEYRPYSTIEPKDKSQSDGLQMLKNCGYNIMKNGIENLHRNGELQSIGRLITDSMENSFEGKFDAKTISSSPLLLEISNNNHFITIKQEEINKNDDEENDNEEKENEKQQTQYKQLVQLKIPSINMHSLSVSYKECDDLYLYIQHISSYNLKVFQNIECYKFFKNPYDDDLVGSVISKYCYNVAISLRVGYMLKMNHITRITEDNRYLWSVALIPERGSISSWDTLPDDCWYTVMARIFDRKSGKEIGDFAIKQGLKCLKDDVDIICVNQYALIIGYKSYDDDKNDNNYYYVCYGSIKSEKQEIANVLMDIVPIDIVSKIISCCEWGYTIDKVKYY